MSERIITIENDTLRVSVHPEIGASVSDFSFRRAEKWIPLMRPAPNPLQRSSLANFIMAPYSNRIRQGKFCFQGGEYQLRNAAKHAIHGDVRDRPWRLVEQQAEKTVLSIDSRAFGDFNFPFALAVDVSYELRDSMFRSELCITNLDSRSMPAGGGFHPYFMRALGGLQEEVELSFRAGGVFEYKGDLPFSEEPARALSPHFDFTKRKPLVEGLDHGYSAWNGKAELFWPKSQVRLHVEAEPSAEHLILYTPVGEPFFAFEPVSNSTDGFNQLENGMVGTGVVVLEAGESLTIAYSLQLEQ